MTPDNHYWFSRSNETSPKLSIIGQGFLVVSGFLGKIANSAMSGEGIVTRFKGNGTVLVCSRNRGAFVGWLASQMPNSK